MAFPGDWNNLRNIDVTEQDGNNYTDAAVRIDLDSNNFDFSKANSDGSDLRFTDSNDNQINFWIEEFDVGSSTAILWVEVSTLSANSTTTIKLYYGNSSASSASNGANTFEFFDDFDGDLSKWNFPDGSGSIVSDSSGSTTVNALEHISPNNSYGALTANFTGSTPLRVRYRFRCPSFGDGDSNNVDGGIVWNASDQFNGYFRTTRIDTNTENWYYKNGQGSYNSRYDGGPGYISSSNWFKLEDKISSSSHKTFVNGSFGTDWGAVDMSEYSSGKIGFRWNQESNRCDWIFVDTYFSTEPTQSVGTEQDTDTVGSVYEMASSGVRKTTSNGVFKTNETVQV